MFSIHSVSSDHELIFHDLSKEYFFIDLKGSNLSAYLKVYIWDGMFVESLDVFFQKLASCKTPWQGEQVWESPEGEFTLSASCTTLGNVFFRIKLLPLPIDEAWQVQAVFESELGQLEKIAKDANLFFRANQ